MKQREIIWDDETEEKQIMGRKFLCIYIYIYIPVVACVSGI